MCDGAYMQAVEKTSSQPHPRGEQALTEGLRYSISTDSTDELSTLIIIIILNIIVKNKQQNAISVIFRTSSLNGFSLFKN